MGAYKMMLFDYSDSIVSRKRPTKSHSPRPVTATELGAEDVGSLPKFNPRASSKLDYTDEDLQIDMRDLIAAGKSNAEIIKALELTQNAPEILGMIEWMRNRVDDV